MEKKKLEFPLGISGAIAYKDNVLSDFLCNSIIDFMQKEENKNLHRVGLTISGVLSDHKICTDATISSGHPSVLDHQKEILDVFSAQIFSSFSPVIEEYTKEYEHMNFWLDRRDTGYQYQHYVKEKGQYKVHVDGSSFDKPGFSERVLAVIMYLNTVEEGGGTDFPMHNLTVNAVRGRIAIFPTNFNYPHAGIMPISSDKHIISSFMYCPLTRAHFDRASSYWGDVLAENADIEQQLS